MTDEQRAMAKSIALTFGPGKHTQLVWDISHAIAKAVEEAVELERAKLLAGVTGVWVDTLRQRGKRDE